MAEYHFHYICDAANQLCLLQTVQRITKLSLKYDKKSRHQVKKYDQKNRSKMITTTGRFGNLKFFCEVMKKNSRSGTLPAVTSGGSPPINTLREKIAFPGKLCGTKSGETWLSLFS